MRGAKDFATGVSKRNSGIPVNLLTSLSTLKRKLQSVICLLL
jgi:hypothetical protein